MFFKDLPAATGLYTALHITPMSDAELLNTHFIPTLRMRHPNEQYAILLRAVMLMSEVQLTNLTGLKFMMRLTAQKSEFMLRLPPPVYTRVSAFFSTLLKY